MTYSDVNSGKSKTYGYQYSSDGNLAGVTENGEQVYTYDYDTLGRLIHSSAVEGGKVVLYTDHIYDTNDRIASQKWQIGSSTFSEQYSYNENNGMLSSMIGAGGETISFGYDNLNRLNGNLLMYGSNQIMRTAYTYKSRNDESEGNTTALVSQIQYNNPDTGTDIIPAINYSYDQMGNIVSVTQSGENPVVYTYDSQNQLKTETERNTTTTYTYDTYGNIQKIAEEQPGIGTIDLYELEYENTQWRDLLTKVSYTDVYGSNTEKSLEYDAIGNPTLYFNGNSTWNFTWEYGRQMASASKGSTVVTYQYDVDGIRKQKTVGNLTYDYVTLNGKIVRETIDADSSAAVVTDYMYDNMGRPYKIVVTTGGATYTGYYVLNQQGDVIAIIDSSGNILVEYSYNAWGRQGVSSNSGIVGNALYRYNSLKYRGYYQDSESGFYYLNSRYYDPVIGRFINADDIDIVIAEQLSLKNKNLYTYCDNNPVVKADTSGKFGFWVTVGVAAVCAIVSGAMGAISAVATGGNAVEGFAKGAVSGAISAVCGLQGVAAGIAGLIIGVADVSISAVSYRIQNGNMEDFSYNLFNSVVAGGTGALGTAIPGFGPKPSNLGNLGNNVLNGYGSALIWSEASVAISATETAVRTVLPDSELPRGSNGKVTTASYFGHSAQQYYVNGEYYDWIPPWLREKLGYS